MDMSVFDDNPGVIKNVDPQAKIDCPMCRLHQMRRHCTGTTANCVWLLCRNKHCQASLDPGHKRGHVLDPDNRLDPKTKARRLVRLVFADNVWKVDPRDV